MFLWCVELLTPWALCLNSTVAGQSANNGGLRVYEVKYWDTEILEASNDIKTKRLAYEYWWWVVSAVSFLDYCLPVRSHNKSMSVCEEASRTIGVLMYVGKGTLFTFSMRTCGCTIDQNYLDSLVRNKTLRHTPTICFRVWILSSTRPASGSIYTFAGKDVVPWLQPRRLLPAQAQVASIAQAGCENNRKGKDKENKRK